MTKKQASQDGLVGLDTTELRLELLRRERTARSLIAKRNALLAKIEKIDEEIAAAGIKPNSPPSGNIFGSAPRAKNEMSLIEALQALLKGKEMGIPEIVPALKSVGYVSHSPNLRTMVNASLLKKNLFKRVGRGVYTAK